MIRRIILENYMSHTRTVIEPAAGLTVLIGPNNCGKSAVVSALENLCNNTSGTYYVIRHKEKEARVTVETDDGHTIVWKRRGNGASYSIDGRDVHRSDPEDLHKILRLPTVNTGENGETFDIHFGAQKSPIFLLDQSPSKAALFFASSSDAAILLKMQKRHRNKVNDRKNDEKRLNAEIGKVDAELAALEPLKTIAISVGEAENVYQELEEFGLQIEALSQDIKDIDSHLAEHQRLAQLYDCLTPLMPTPSMADPTPLETLLHNLRNARHDLLRFSQRAKAFELLLSPPEPDDAKSLESLIKAMSDELKNCRSLGDRTRRLYCLQDVPQMAEVDFLTSLTKRLHSLEEDYRIHTERQRVFYGLMEPPQLGDPKPMVDLINSLEHIIQEVVELEHEGNAALEDLKELEAEIQIAERTPHASLATGSLEKERRTPYLRLTIGLVAGVAAMILLLISWSGWRERLRTGASSPDRQSINSLEAVATTNDREMRRNFNREAGQKINDQEAAQQKVPTLGPSGVDRKDERLNNLELKKETPKKIETTKEESKKLAPQKDGESKTEEREKAKPNKGEARPSKEPNEEKSIRLKPQSHEVGKVDGKTEEPKKAKAKKEETSETKQMRLKEVQKLLRDAETADAKGNYLEAVLGFGQAAILYPNELAEVEDPDKVRMKFIGALKRYQAEVEQALAKAAVQNPGKK